MPSSFSKRRSAILSATHKLIEQFWSRGLRTKEISPSNNCRRILHSFQKGSFVSNPRHAFFVFLVSNTQRIEEALRRGFTNFEHEVALSVIVHADQSRQQVELYASHLHGSAEQDSVRLGEVDLFVENHVIDEGHAENCQVVLPVFLSGLVVLIVVQHLIPIEHHSGCETTIVVLGKDRLGDIAFVLLVKTLAVFDGRQCPFIHVQFKILKDSCGLASLSLDEVQEGLALASIRMLPVNPCRYLLPEDLVNAKGPASSLFDGQIFLHSCDQSEGHPWLLLIRFCLSLLVFQNKKLICYD
jgi:hypothetical protein